MPSSLAADAATSRCRPSKESGKGSANISALDAPSAPLPSRLPFFATANLQAAAANGHADELTTSGGDPVEIYRDYRGVQQSPKAIGCFTFHTEEQCHPNACLDFEWGSQRRTRQHQLFGDHPLDSGDGEPFCCYSTTHLDPTIPKMQSKLAFPSLELPTSLMT
jgi:hypothetical protein